MVDISSMHPAVDKNGKNFVTVAYSFDDIPANLPVFIFCANPDGEYVRQICHERGISVLGFIDLIRTTPLGDDACFNFEQISALNVGKFNIFISFPTFEKYMGSLDKTNANQLITLHLLAEEHRKQAVVWHGLPPGKIYDDMVTAPPHPQNAVDIFRSEWMSRLPIAQVSSGWNPLFDDPRIRWALEKLGSFKDKNILELGPYEGGHTYQLDRLYGGHVTAIEANPRAFLRCLITKNLLRMERSQFLLGNFLAYLAANPSRYDVVFASGVLYHMEDPVFLLESLSKITDRIFMWTHFYDDTTVRSNSTLRHRFDPNKDEVRTFRHINYQTRFFCYLDGQESTRHLGGLTTARWLYLEDILRILALLGFDRVETGLFEWVHAYGPNCCIAASRSVPQFD